MLERANIKEDVILHSQCGRCYAQCGIRVRRVNGVAVRIEGVPESSLGPEGGLCGKGSSGLQVLYDPNRLNRPLRRTNPEKGLHVDPKWKEISWDDAIEEIVNKLRDVIEDDPKKILIQGTTCRPMRNTTDFLFPLAVGLSSEKGAPCGWPGGGGLHCGNGAHENTGMIHASWSHVPDFRLCDYAIYFGASKGHGSGHSAMITARLAAEAKSRGMKLVVFDPICNFAGGKASEWIPIIPGTDAAVVLAMANIIINEIGVYDENYVALKTNGPYLVGPDGRYVREKGPMEKPVMVPGFLGMGPPVPAVGGGEDNKPLVWDASENKAKVYDDPTIGEYAIHGEFEVSGIKCKPGFQLLKDHLKTYTPDYASRVSSVPADTIRRIAREFLEAAKIGATIKVQGHELPYRPAAAVLFRGGQGHENSHHTCLAVSMLNAVVGNCDVPGGALGWPARCLGYPETGRLGFEPYKGVDGMIETDNFYTRLHGPWPPHLPHRANDPSLQDIFTLAPFTFVFGSSDQEELWKKLGIKHNFEVLLSHGCNTIMSLANPEVTAETLKKMPFIVVWELFNNELTEGFADIVLPDTCYLEEPSWVEGYAFNFNHAFGMDDWCYHVIQPVVEPLPERRYMGEVVRDILDRLGKTPRVNGFYNKFCDFDDAHRLGPEERLGQTEICDRVLKHFFGEEKGWEYFRKHGFIKWPKKVEEAYWRPFIDARHVIYLEYMVDIGEKVREITQEAGIKVRLEQYTPLISWFPCSIHEVGDSEYDLYCFSYRDILHTGSHTMEQPWLNEASEMNPYTYNITMNADTGRKKGLADGDLIELESSTGGRASGTVKLMEGQHPRTVGIAACSGHWTRSMPIATGKGTHFDALMACDLDHVDPVSLNIETAAKVRVRKLDA
ncbi:MAG: molybdopterin-dependent oxidoreductase [Deltaproteobacteria bacterium]|nr:molybdopterin-dependent oxidoreductase [Deltaproteobacteria bacterium]MBW2136383.1 molybdopterin-dependent oxidoreductase [Deltaproteobacteria bacterium]